MLADAFGQSTAQGTFIKRFLQILSVLGMVLLPVDIGFLAVDVRIGTFTPYLTMLAVVFFRGSMALGYCIMRILAYIRQKRLKQPPGKSWVPVNIHIPFEVAGFALSFLSLSDRLSRIDYKLVSISSNCAM